MNPNDCDHPDLTAHVLGELDTEHAQAMAQWIESRPEAKLEAEHIGELAQMLTATAPVSFYTLRPEQRTAVLSGPQKVRQMVAAVKQPRRASTPTKFSYAWGLGGLAAAAAVAIIGFVAGVHFGSRSAGSTEVASTPPAAPEAVTEKPKTEPFRAKLLPVPVLADATPVEQPAPAAPEVVEKAPEPKKVEAVVAVVPKLDIPAAPEPAKVVVAAPSNVIHGQAFVSTSKVTQAQVTLHPEATRAAVAAAKTGEGPVLGSPMTATGPKKDAGVKAGKQPELMIHSWKADVVSCPWDESRRLVRLVLQLPGDQAAAIGSNAYPLQMNFSPATVRSFRQLGERTVPAKDAESPAFHIVWFEVIPNGSLAEGGTRALGDVTLPNARFTTQVPSAFDSSKLKVLDRGTSWQNARQDFLFESALVGFGLLMKGDKEAGALNHAMVMDLALRSKHDDQANPEFAKFIKVVREAGRVAGVK